MNSSTLIETVARTIDRHAMFPVRARVGVAVSGGADSICLLHALLEIRPDLELVVLHLNHGLRGPASDQDAAFVASLAARLELRFEGRRVELSGNIEQAGREARLAFFRDMLAAGLERIATGHTLSDQAETVFYRFIRGSGAAGLAGILPVMPGGIVRPLIEVSRPDVEAWLRSRGIAWREDASNLSPEFARNRIRHEFLPALAALNPRLPETLARSATIARDEEAYWDEVVAERAAAILTSRPPYVLFPAAAIAELPRAVARRLLRRAVELAKGDLRSIGALHIEAMLELAGGQPGSGRLQVPGLDVFRSFDWVRLGPPQPSPRPDYNIRLDVPGRFRVPGTQSGIETLLETSPADPQTRYNVRESALDWEAISGTLELRNWRPGDRYRPVGHACETKLKTLFQEARIPLWERSRWPVILCGNDLIWAARFGPAAQFAATPRTRTVLRVREIEFLTEI